MYYKQIYCENCETYTTHKCTSENEQYGVFGRLVLAIGTAGINELINTWHYKCQKCKEETTKEFI